MRGDRFPQRRYFSHEVPNWVPEGDCFFITINCSPPGTNQLCRSSIASAVLEAFAHNQQQQIWHVHIALLMPDHLHTILDFDQGQSMKATISNWKHFLSRKTGIRWQREFFDHRLRNHSEFAQKLDYIRENPVRKNLCQKPEDWPHVLTNDP